MVQSLLFIRHCTMSPMLDTDDVIRVRVAAECWNDGRLYGKMGNIFFQLLHRDPFVKHWYYDAEGCKLCTLRYPIMESFRKMGLQEVEVFIPPHYPCTLEGEDMSRSSKDRIYDLFIKQPNATALIRCRTAAYLLSIMGTL